MKQICFLFQKEVKKEIFWTYSFFSFLETDVWKNLNVGKSYNISVLIEFSLNVKYGWQNNAALTFNFELLGDGEEGVEVVLGHIHLAVIHKVEDGLQVSVLDPLEVEQRVLVRVAPQDSSTHTAIKHLILALVRKLFIYFELLFLDKNSRFNLLPVSFTLLK